MAANKRASKNTTAKPPSPARTGSVKKIVLLVATRKGGWLFHSNTRRKKWAADGPHFLGQIIHHMVLDPRDGKTLLAAASAGHLGPTMFRSTNLGRKWTEVAKPPAFAKSDDGQGRSVKHTFWLTPCHANEPRSWYAGTSPQGLFRSDDGGNTWAPFSSVNTDPAFRQWMGGEQDGTPDGPKLHSIIVDPRDPKHFYIAMSGGGFHETLDRGRTWQTLINGMEVVAGFDASNLMFHDPHCVRMCPSNPDRLYQQNHCGIYRLDRPAQEWQRIGKGIQKKVGDIGFPIVLHPRDDKTAWVLPMDGTSVWPRTSPQGKPAVYVTRNSGKSWKRLDKGFPDKQAWWTVKRQAMTIDRQDKLGVYFGTTSGEIWLSRNEGDSWHCISRHLPEIYALEVAEI